MSIFLEIQTPSAEHYEYVGTIIELDCARSFNQVGALTVRVPMWFEPGTVRRNSRLLLWEQDRYGDARLLHDTVWLVRKKRWRASDKTTILTAECPMGLLNRRIVAHPPQTDYADKTLDQFEIDLPDDRLRIDNMMRAYVRENFVDPVDTARSLASYFAVEADRNLGIHSEKTAAWIKILQICQDLARSSEEGGQPLTFDVIATPESPIYTFKLFYNTRGIDRGLDSNNPLVFSQNLGNLTEVEVEEDYSEEGTAVYSLGGDSGASRIYEVVLNDQAIRADPFNRIEFSLDVGDIDEESISVLIEAGLAALQGRRPRLRITGKTVDNGGVIYGRDYQYGDRVVVQEQGVQMNASVSAARITISQGRISRDVRLSAEEYL